MIGKKTLEAEEPPTEIPREILFRKFETDYKPGPLPYEWRVAIAEKRRQKFTSPPFFKKKTKRLAELLLKRF